jgi:hypothetical protein
MREGNNSDYSSVRSMYTLLYEFVLYTYKSALCLSYVYVTVYELIKGTIGTSSVRSMYLIII